MRSILAIAFAGFSTLVAFSAHQSASATINEYQEKQADAICNVDPSQCGLK